MPDIHLAVITRAVLQDVVSRYALMPNYYHTADVVLDEYLLSQGLPKSTTIKAYYPKFMKQPIGWRLANDLHFRNYPRENRHEIKEKPDDIFTELGIFGLQHVESYVFETEDEKKYLGTDGHPHVDPTGWRWNQGFESDLIEKTAELVVSRMVKHSGSTAIKVKTIFLVGIRRVDKHVFDRMPDKSDIHGIEVRHVYI